MNNEKQKKIIAPNECSFIRWIITLLVGGAIGILIALPGLLPLAEKGGVFMGLTYESMASLVVFVGQFFGFWIALKLVAKTSLRDFVFGVGGKFNKKVSLIIFVLYALGMAIPFLLTIDKIQLRDVQWEQFAFLVGFMLLTAICQTTWEELVCRGILLRWGLKNKFDYSKKAWILAVITTIIFMLGHVSNPEVTSQSGADVAISIVTYCIPGFVCVLANLHFGDLMPGIIIHWVNNFTLFTLISETNNATAVPVPSLFSYSPDGGAVWGLISTLIPHIPVLIYILVDAIKRKKAA